MIRDKYLWDSGYFLILYAEYVRIRHFFHPENDEIVIFRAEIVQLTTA
jgi:hypothetical protein